MSRITALLASAILGAGVFATSASAQGCSDTSSGFDAWKANFAQVAASQGVGQRGL